MTPPRAIHRLAIATTGVILAASLAGCTAASTPVPRPEPTGTTARGAGLPVAAFAGASGMLLTELGNGRTLQWLQVTDSGTAYSSVASGAALAALAGAAPAGWTTPKGADEVVDVGPVLTETDAFYSREVDTLAALPDGAIVVVPKEEPASSAALLLLADEGLIEVEGDRPSIDDVTANPRGLDLRARAESKLVAALKPAAAVYVPAGAAVTGGLDATDAILAEPRSERATVGLVAAKSEAESKAVRAFYARLTSKATRAWIRTAFKGVAEPAA